MKNEIIISIVIPAYNEEIGLERCMKTIIAQDNGCIEIVLIDDGSTDRTYDVMCQYEKEYPFVHVFRVTQNAGQSHARNIGIEQSRGEYIWFVDADDYILDGAINDLCRLVKKVELDCVFFFWKRKMGEYIMDTPQKIELEDISPDRIYTGRELFKLMVERLPRVSESVGRYIVRKAFIKEKKIRFVEGAIYEDGMFGIEMYLKAKKIKLLHESYYVYDNNTQSTGHTVDATYKFACAFIEFVHYFELGLENIDKMDTFWDVYAKNLYSIYIEADSQYYKLKLSDPMPIIKNIKREAGWVFSALYGGENRKDRFFEIERLLYSELESNNDIIIYGAAAKARELAEFLDGKEKRILAYLVSDEHAEGKEATNPKYIYGVPVLGLSKGDSLSRKALVIVTVRKVHKENIRENLRKAGFENVLFLE